MQMTEEIKTCCATLYQSDWARILLGEAASHLRGANPVARAIFCLFGDEAFGVYRAAIDELMPPTLP